MRVLLALAMLVFTALSAVAAEKSRVNEVIRLVRKHKHRTSKPPYTFVRVKGEDRSLILLIIDGEDGSVNLGIYSDIIVGAKESDYEMDTPCLVRLEDRLADGIVDGYKLDCIAWTPKLEPYIKENAQRIYDELLLEGGVLLNRK